MPIFVIYLIANKDKYALKTALSALLLMNIHYVKFYKYT